MDDDDPVVVRPKVKAGMPLLQVVRSVTRQSGSQLPLAWHESAVRSGTGAWLWMSALRSFVTQTTVIDGLGCSAWQDKLQQDNCSPVQKAGIRRYKPQVCRLPAVLWPCLAFHH